MKLRFRADTKDAIIFGIFSLAWLFVVALAVANVSAFINNEPFTINFLLGFLPKNLAATLLFFFAGIIAAFAGVKSVFLEREDDATGIGITIGQKKEKNYARWAKDNEIKNGLDVKLVNPLAPKADAGGIPLIMNPKEV